MRVPRSLVLGPGSAFHLWWRGHNREFVLASQKEKSSYLAALSTALRNVRQRFGHDSIRIFSFCLMSNHAHMSGLLDPHADSVSPLSRLFQSAHSVFGRWYNHFRSRSGKVAEERFHTRLTEDDRALQTVMLYGDANPVLAGIVKHPAHYPWSSYRFFAFGEKVPGWQLLTPPGWYLNLGNTPARRQRQYRRLLDRYIREKRRLKGIPDGAWKPPGYFLGSAAFIDHMSQRLRAALKRLRDAARDPPA